MKGDTREADSFSEMASQGELNSQLHRFLSAIAHRCMRRIPARAPLGVTIRRILTYLLMALLAFSPCMLLPIESSLGDTVGDAIWTPYYSAFNFCQILFPWLVWRRIEAGAASLDSIFAITARHERGRIVRQLRCWLSTRRLLWFMIPGGLTGLAIAFVSPHMTGGEMRPSRLLSLLVTGALVGHSLVLITIATVVPSRISLATLDLRWNAPLDTPGLVVLSRSVSLTAQLGFALFLIVQIRIGYSVISDPTGAVLVAYVVTSLTSAGFVTLVGIVVQRALSTPASTQRDRTLAELATKIRGLRADMLARNGIRGMVALVSLRAYVDLYSTVAATPVSFVRTSILSQYIGSLLGVVLQLAIPLVLKQ